MNHTSARPDHNRFVPAALALLAVLSALGLWWYGPIRQDPGYHVFADRRPLLGIPNCLDVLSNAPIGLAGLWGLAQARVRRTPWTLVAAMGLLLTGIGSSYYHLAPDSQRLFWDRLPLTIVLMGFFAGVLADRTGLRLLAPLLVLGAGSVVLWRVTDDLRVYGFVQYFPMIALPILLLGSRPTVQRTGPLIATLLLYALAKVCELGDQAILDLTGCVSGHTLKHLFAGAAGFAMLRT